jgi:hypothetical protein
VLDRRFFAASALCVDLDLQQPDKTMAVDKTIPFLAGFRVFQFLTAFEQFRIYHQEK